MNDIEIAKSVPLEKITNVAEKFGITEEDLIPYGKYKAKVDNKLMKKLANKENGKLILVTSINPTPLRRRKNDYFNWFIRWIKSIGEKISIGIKRTIFGTSFWYERWCNRRRICASCSNG